MKKIKCIIMSTALLISYGLRITESVKADNSGDCGCTYRCKAHKYHTFNDYYLRSSDGSKNGKKYYYIDTATFQSADVQYVMAGVAEWMTIEYIRNYVELTRTYNESEAQIVIKKGMPPDGASGITYIYANAGDANPMSNINKNYSKAVIIMDDTLNTASLRLVTLHEVGHAIGLSHAECQEYNSVMWVAYDNMSTVVTNFDKSNFRHIYC